MRNQKGLVLITAVLIVAILATLATYLSLGQQMWLRQTENLNGRAQTESLRQGALAWIGILLARDARDNKVDHLKELWAGQLPPLPAEGGLLAVKLEDAQGRFNLNNLVRAGQASANDVRAFQRLLTILNLDPLLANALLDWMDADSNPAPGGGGGENVDYLARTPSYRVADQSLTSVEELRLVKGFTPAIVEALKKHVAVLPEGSAINVNTASREVLVTLFPSDPGSLLDEALKEREKDHFKNTGDFTGKFPAGAPQPQGNLSVNTQHFLVTINIRIGRFERRSEALIHRPENKPANVVWQRLNPMLPEPKANDQK
jgi:general secretion pathway protein K